MTPEQKAARQLLRDLGLTKRVVQVRVWHDSESGFWAVYQPCDGGEEIVWYSVESLAYARANRINRALGFPEVKP
jgi:hypothetical protein